MLMTLVFNLIGVLPDPQVPRGVLMSCLGCGPLRSTDLRRGLSLRKQLDKVFVVVRAR
jgi:hypothetical protein